MWAHVYEGHPIQQREKKNIRCKGKKILIKYNMLRYVEMAGRNMEAFVASMRRTIAQKDTILRESPFCGHYKAEDMANKHI